MVKVAWRSEYKNINVLVSLYLGGSCGLVGGNKKTIVLVAVNRVCLLRMDVPSHFGPSSFEYMDSLLREDVYMYLGSLSSKISGNAQGLIDSGIDVDNLLASLISLRKSLESELEIDAQSLPNSSLVQSLE